MTSSGTAPALSGTAALDVQPTPPRDGPRFELRNELGLGGMGKIQLAHDRWLDRDVALKLPATEADARRLAREALVTARLEHPAIVPIYDSGVLEDGRPWFAMRLVRGTTLAARLADPSLTDGMRAGLLRHVLAACDGLAFAHARGVVHRDLKPSNIMIGAFGETQIIDWGLALTPDLPPADGPRAGTPGAMSPEQQRGDTPDARSDVWALGAMLARVLPDPPPELAAICARATHHDPSMRYPDARALALDLAAYLDGRRVAAHAYSRAELFARFVRAWRGPLAVAGIALFVLAVVLAILITRLQVERDQAEANLAVSLTSEARRALHADARGEAALLAAHALARAPLAEARGILAAAGGAAPTRVVLDPIAATCTPVDLVARRVLCRAPERLSMVADGVTLWERHADNDGALLLDGGRVAVVEERALLRLDAMSGAVVSGPEPLPCFTRLVGGGGVVFSWNGGCAVRVLSDRIEPLPADLCTGAIGALGADGPRWAATCGDGSIVTSDGTTHRRIDAHLGVSPAGPLPTALAFGHDDILLVGDAAGGVMRLALATPDRHEALVVHDGGLVQRLVVSPDGTHAVALVERAAPLLIDLARFATLGRLPSSVRAVAFEADAVIAAGTRLERWDFAAVLPRTIELGAGIGGLAFSPDGRRLAVGHDNAVTLWDLATLTRVADHAWQPDHVKSFAFMPDGALVAHGLGDHRLMRLAPDGTRADLASAAPAHWRRVVPLADGSILLATYSARVTRRTADGRFERALDRELVDLAASHDGLAVAGLGADHQIYCGAALTPCGRDPHARALALADPDALFLARDGSLARLDAGEITAVYPLPGVDVLDLAVARRPDGERWIAAAARDGSLWLFRASSPEPWATLRDHDARCDTIAFAPDGSLVVAGGWDGRVVLWPVPMADVDQRAALEARWGMTLGDVFSPRIRHGSSPR